jgi:hypothetical protein
MNRIRPSITVQIKQIFKRAVIGCLIILLFSITIFTIHNYPFSSEPKDLARLSDTNNIRRNLESIINTPGYRNAKNVAVLDTVAEKIRMEFVKHTDRVSIQDFKVNENGYKNIIASFGPQDGERIIVGAHYDVRHEEDGADDNASGVAGILELARLLKGQSLKYRIDLVAYTLEEPPFFGTEQMGSYVHAKSLHDAKVPVKGMISLEMIGYYSDEEGSQSYPIGALKWLYGNKGNFITVVQKSFCGSFAKQYRKLAFKNNSILTKGFRTPSFLGGDSQSDHNSYWKFGYSAIMITNTAFFRNHNYHKKGDQLATLNIPKMGLAIDGVFRTLIELE